MDGDSPKVNNTLPEILKPHGPTCRPSLKQFKSSEANSLTHNSKELDMKDVQQNQKSGCIHKSSALSDDDKQINYIHKEDELDEEESSNHLDSKSLNCSREQFSPERAENSRNNESFFKEDSRKILPKKNKLQSSNTKQNTNGFFYLIIAVIIVIVCLILNMFSSTSKNQTEPITNNRNLIIETLRENIQHIKSKFDNQDSYIWDEILSGINEVKTKTPKVPSIILLFANEMHTMDCLAKALANFSSNILGGDSPLNLNPKNFGDDPGEIIDTLKNSTKKAVIIRDVLNINAEAIQALHNLCDRENPLIREVIYIITMKTKNYESQQKMAFVEKHFYHKLSKSINEDILTALVTRITDGAVILVQPEPNLRYC